MGTQTKLAEEKMIFRKTNSQTGRRVAITPDNSTMRHLAYGRIMLNSAEPAVSFANGNRETGLICLSGEAFPGKRRLRRAKRNSRSANSMPYMFPVIHRSKFRRIPRWIWRSFPAT